MKGLKSGVWMVRLMWWSWLGSLFYRVSLNLIKAVLQVKRLVGKLSLYIRSFVGEILELEGQENEKGDETIYRFRLCESKDIALVLYPL